MHVRSGTGQDGRMHPGEPTAVGTPLRPLGAAEILDGAVRGVRRNFRAVAAIAVPFALVQSAAGALLILALSHSSPLNSLVLLGGQAIALAVGTVRTGVLAPVFAEDLFGRRVVAGAAVRELGRRWFPLVLIAVVATIAEVGGLLPFAVLGVWLWGVWAVVAPALVLERTTLGRAFGRSFALVRDNFWRTWGIRALGWVLTTVLGALIVIPFEVIALLVTDTDPGDSAASIGNVGVFVTIVAVGTLLQAIVLGPVTSAIETLLYVDLRMRREGMDLVLELPKTTAVVG